MSTYLKLVVEGEYVSIETPNTILISYVFDCKVFVVENSASLLTHIFCNVNEAIHNIMRS